MVDSEFWSSDLQAERSFPRVPQDLRSCSFAAGFCARLCIDEGTENDLILASINSAHSPHILHIPCSHVQSLWTRKGGLSSLVIYELLVFSGE